MEKKILIPALMCIILLVVSIVGNLSFWTSLNQANSEITSLETTVYTKSSEIENLEQEVDSLGSEKEALEAQTSDLEATLNTKESEIETLESQVTGLQADKNNLQSQINSLETDKSQLESQVNSLQTDKSSLQTQVSSLETENNQLQTWLDGNKSQISFLEASIFSLENAIESLEDENTWLKQHSFTYYTVGDAINISNVGIFEEWLFGWTINGTITNISDKPIETVYVYLILRNPDGTADFDTWDYEEIGNLYIGETSPFEFPYSSYDGSQTVEIFLVY